MKWFYDLSIAAKLIIAFALLLAVSAALNAFTITQLDRVNSSTETISNVDLPIVEGAQQLKAAVLEAHAAQQEYINPYASSDSDVVKEQLDSRLTFISTKLSELQRLITSPDSKAALDKMIATFAQYQSVNDKAFKAFSEYKMLDGRDILIQESTPLYKELFQTAESLAVLSNKHAGNTKDIALGIYSQARLISMLLTIASIIFGMILATWIARTVAGPLRYAVSIAERVAQGDLTSVVKIDRNDETGKLMRALGAMNSSLQTIVSQIRSSATAIHSASNEITSGNMDLSSRTEQQAGSLEETASAMEQLTSTVRQNADNASQANKLAASASGVAVDGGAIVAEVVKTMGSINESSTRIVDIIAVIDGIAFQTNILALNAAVEAARAGEQGRGFAVVASEVRNLAQRSASAAKEIKELIDNSVEQVGTGSKLVERAGSTMEEIVTSIRRVTDIVSEIAAASAEQSNGIQEVNRAITQMDQTTQQNAVLVEQATSSTRSMEAQTSELLHTVNMFTVDAALEQTSKARPATKAPVDITPKSTPPRKATLSQSMPAQAAAARPAPPKPALATTAPDKTDDWEEF